MATVSAEPLPTAAVAGATRRLVNVDALRALAALAVLVGHAYALGGRAIPIKAEHWYDVGLITLATGVWLFFAISGYVIARPFVDRLVSGAPLPSLRRYAVRRAARIFPLYWVALAAIVALDGGQGTRGWQYGVHVLLLNNLVPGRQGALFSVAWTLTLEVLFYVLVPVCAIAVRTRWRGPAPAVWLAGAVLVSWVASIAFTVIADLQGDGQIGLWLRGSLPAMWQMFCPGLLLAIGPHLPAGRLRAIVVDLPRARAWRWVAAAAIVPGALLGAAAPLGHGVVVYQLLVDASRPLFAVGYGLVLAAAIAAPARRGRLGPALGLAGYGIYLLHPVIAAVLVKASLVPAARDTPAAFVVNAALLAALTIAAALASWRWFERPLLDWGSAR